MQESFNPYELLEYLWNHRKLIIGVPVVAAAIALVVSLLLPNKYTATATIIIEPPGASDPRVATAVSPVYLESLKTYEQFASSDTLFARACEKFHLLPASGGPAIESFKRSVLKVQKLKETKILQISVTLRDPKQAQALVQFLAEQTVALSQSLSRESDRDAVQTARAQLDEAASKLARAEKDWSAVAATNSDTALQSQIDSLAMSKSEVNQEIVTATGQVAEYGVRDAGGQEKPARARLVSLMKERTRIDNEITAKTAALAQWQARKQRADIDLRAAQSAHDLALKRFGDVDSAVGLRGEQLRIIDPGIVPQKPTSPDIPLNCAAAFLLGAVVSLSYVTLRFGYDRSRTQPARSGFRVA